MVLPRLRILCIQIGRRTLNTESCAKDKARKHGVWGGDKRKIGELTVAGTREGNITTLGKTQNLPNYDYVFTYIGEKWVMTKYRGFFHGRNWHHNQSDSEIEVSQTNAYFACLVVLTCQATRRENAEEISAAKFVMTSLVVPPDSVIQCHTYWIWNLITNISMGQSSTWGANRLSSGQELLTFTEPGSSLRCS
jgi:hypothetical protein